MMSNVHVCSVRTNQIRFHIFHRERVYRGKVNITAGELPVGGNMLGEETQKKSIFPGIRSSNIHRRYCSYTI